MGDHWIIIAAIVVVVFIVVGLIKKMAWMWIVALVVAIALGLTNPEPIANITEGIVDFFDGGIDPLSDNDYSEEKDALRDELKGDDDR